MKSGTGELLKLLNFHPYLVSGVSNDGKREVHFFDNKRLYNSSKCRLIEYIKSFPVKYSRKFISNKYHIIPNIKSLSFDKTPSYIKQKVNYYFSININNFLNLYFSYRNS